MTAPFTRPTRAKWTRPRIASPASGERPVPHTGTRQGKTVLVQLRDALDPENGERYTVKRYDGEKAKAGDSWCHTRITLKPVNPDFAPIILSGTDEGQVRVIAEVVEVLGTPALLVATAKPMKPLSVN